MFMTVQHELGATEMLDKANPRTSTAAASAFVATGRPRGGQPDIRARAGQAIERARPEAVPIGQAVRMGIVLVRVVVPSARAKGAVP
jgi:hypothetical protein